MFVWECIKSEGTHVGVCVDTFMFGSCCVHNTTTNAITASNLHHQHHHHHHHHHYHQQHGASSSSEPLRPTLAEALGNESTRPTLTSLSSFLVTDTSTARPSHHPSETLDSSGVSTRPHKPLSAGSARPLQKRPHAKPTSDHKDRIQTSVVPGSSNFWEKSPQSTKRPASGGSVDLWEKGSQNTKRPNSQSTKRPGAVWEDNGQNTKRPGHHDSLNVQKTRPENGQHADVKEKDTTHESFQNHHQGFKDKVESGHNTLVIRLPGKEHASSEDEGIRPNRPNSQRPSESRPDDSKTEEDADLSVQESIHRPSVNSVDENIKFKSVSSPLQEPVKDPHPSFNFIHTERPQWATKPVSPKPTTDFSKPYFSIKTTTYRPIPMNDQPDTRPNFVSKPNSSGTVMKTSTTARPTHFNGQFTTSAAGSLPQTSHWHVTTEPVFVTKQRPSSSTKPMGSLETTKPLTSSSHFWSENSWTPPRPSLKPHWTDNPSLLQNGPEAFPPRPSFKPTEPQ
ncbi:unnamed protein product, partial [Heterotrigona itama]